MGDNSLSGTRALSLLILLTSFALLDLAANGSQGQKPKLTQTQVIDESVVPIRVERQDRVGLTRPPKSTISNIIFTLLISATAVSPGSAADIAGLKPGDLIFRVGGVSMRGVQTLRAIETCAPGTIIDVEYGRPGPGSPAITRVHAQARLGPVTNELRNPDQASEAPMLPFDLAYQDQVLLTQKPPRSRFGVAGDAIVLLTYVGPGSPAEQAGLKPGDLIVEIGGLRVRGVQTLRSVQTEPPGTLIDVVYLRREPDSGTTERFSTRLALAPLKGQQ